MRHASRLSLILSAGLAAGACERGYKTGAPFLPVASGSTEPRYVSTLSLESTDWDTVAWQAGLSACDGPYRVLLGNDASRHLTLDFPTDGWLSYLYIDKVPKQIRGTVSASLEMTLSGTAAIEYAPAGECPRRASVRGFIWAHGRDCGSREFDRWWSDPLELTPGAMTIEVPLTPDRWISVLGKRGTDAPDEFRQALGDVTYLGLGFGGGCYAAHGVGAQGGRAAFTIHSYQITSLGAP